MQRQFIPFRQIENQREIIIVDGHHSQGLILSHWKGANKLANLADDSSGAIVLNALEQQVEGIDFPLVTATHFDIDGFVGVWSLFYPELALKHKELLKKLAYLGDFRSFGHALSDFDSECDTAIKLACWLNALEKKIFYQPFASKDELDSCVPKFEYFIPRFKAVLENPEAFRSDWEEEYLEVCFALEQIQNPKITQFAEQPALGLLCISTPNPLHYYGLFAPSQDSDIVLSMYTDNRYELEFKYTTWVDIVSRPTLPRIDMSPLVDKLNCIEKSGYTWHCDKPSDTGPILRLEENLLSKAERYANPTQRTIYSSSIEANHFKSLVFFYLNKTCQDIQPKKFWTWKEMRERAYFFPKDLSFY